MIWPLIEFKFTAAAPPLNVCVTVFPLAPEVQMSQYMDPFMTVALSWNEAELGAVKEMLSFVVVKLYVPFMRSVANLAVTLPFVETAVAFTQ